MKRLTAPVGVPWEYAVAVRARARAAATTLDGAISGTSRAVPA